MEPLKPPKTRWVGAVLIVLIALLFVVQGWGGFFEEQITVAGLILDIVGAFILAVPDIPRIYRHFVPGRVGEVMNLLSLKLGKGSVRSSKAEHDLDAEPSDKSFYTFRNAIARAQSRISSKQGDRWRETEQILKQEDFTKTSSDKLWLKGYRAGVHPGLTEPEIRVGYEHMMDVLEADRQKLEARFRRSGILVLVVGFSLQVFAFL
jgi:hypothetical protein